MKQLQNGTKAFYAGVFNRILALAMVALTAGGAAAIWPMAAEAEQQTRQPLFLLIFLLLLLAGIFLYALWQMKKPVCLICPDRICSRRQELFWPEVQFYNKDCHNKYYPFIVAGIKNGEGYCLTVAFLSLSRKDQKLLEQELLSRNIPMQKEYFERIHTEDLPEALEQIQNK